VRAMKRGVAIVLGLVAAGVASEALAIESGVMLADCTYTISVPGESDVWNTGTAGFIQWFKTGTCSQRMDLDLWREGERITTIASNEQNNGTYNWVVPTYIRTALQYRVRIRDRDDYDSHAFSAEFTIFNPAHCGYRVTDPTSSSVWERDSIVTIRWNRAGNCTSPVDIHLLWNGQQVAEIASRTSDVGTYNWRVSDRLDTGGGYSVRVRDSNDHNSYDNSDSFVVGEAPDPCIYEVTSPDSSSVWHMGAEENMAWTSGAECGASVDLDLLLDGEPVADIAEGLIDSGLYEWSVPVDLTATDGYAVRVQAEGDSAVFAVSEGFTISEPLPEDRVYWIEAAARLSGEAGSVWRTDLAIKNLSDSDADVLIRLRGAGGGTLDTVVSGGAQAAYEDVLGLMGKEGKGWLEITSTKPILASGRIYNLGDEGTFGQYDQGFPQGGGLLLGEFGYLLQLRQLEGGFRTNLTFTNPTAEDAAVQVALFDAEGTELIRYRIDLDPRSLYQDLAPFEQRAERPNLGWGFATVEILDGTSVLISASVVDSRTNDGTTIPVKLEDQ